MAQSKLSSLSSIVSAVKGLYVETSQSALAREALMEFYLAFAPGPQGACMTLQGVSGSGKTTVLRNFLEQDIPQLAGDEEGRAIYVEVPAMCSPKSVAQAILQALGDPLWHKGSGTDLKYRIGNILKQKGYRLLALDECQHMIESRSDRVLYDVADWLKSAINLWSIPVILSGLPKIQSIIDANDQLNGRKFRGAELGPISWKVKEEQRDYRLVLKRYDECLPFPQKAGLEDTQTAKTIHFLTDGLFGKTNRLIILAAINSARLKKESITAAALGMAFEELRNGNDELKENPFLNSGARESDLVDISTDSRKPLKPSGALHRALSTKSAA